MFRGAVCQIQQALWQLSWLSWRSRLQLTEHEIIWYPDAFRSVLGWFCQSLTCNLLISPQKLHLHE